MGQEGSHHLHIEGKDLVFVEKINEGAYGFVDLVQDAAGHSYALKRVLAQDKDMATMVEREIDVMVRLQLIPISVHDGDLLRAYAYMLVLRPCVHASSANYIHIRMSCRTWGPLRSPSIRHVVNTTF